ncbi:MAG: rRNA (uracil1939-C5)-methyltransferase [Bacillota bacterium]|nr:rRNA (uracil1939-C5)-methyltransferase [Bacillota bacterium]
MGQNQVFSIQITDLNHAGEGVGRKDGRVVFVPYGTPGDIAVVRIVEERRGFARAELLSLERESPDRVLPPCPVYLQCGGCQLQHISYDAQLAYKKRRVEQALGRIGKLEGVPVEDCLPAPRVFHYRNKAKFSYSTRPATRGPSEVFQRRAPNHSFGDVFDPRAAGGAGDVCGAQDAGGARNVRAIQDAPVDRDGSDGRNGLSGPDACAGRGGFVSGFYGRRTHDVVDFNECLIQTHTNNKVFQTLNAVVAERRIPVCGGGEGLDAVPDGSRTGGGAAGSNAPREGALSHLVARCTGSGEKALAVLVASGGPLPEADGIARELMARTPELVGVIEEVEDEEDEEGGAPMLRPGRRARGPGGRSAEGQAPSRVIRGTGLLRERILGLEFIVSVKSFLQVNSEGMEVLYREALRAADLSGGEVALDAYCGIGTISLLLARECRHVYGIEVASAAVEDAKKNAELNHLVNCTFIAGRVEDVLSVRAGRAPGGRKAGNGAPGAGGDGRRARNHDRRELPDQVDIVVLDPPRAGCDVRALQAITCLRPARIVYVSCNPETLARDLALLAESGFRVTQVQPVDMFPQTAHAECVVRLEGERR